MSEKMLKRSLALGALMAFVITGSAWAENITNQTEAEAKMNTTIPSIVVDGAITAIDGNVDIIGGNDTTSLTVNGGDVVNYSSAGKKNGTLNVGIGGDMRDNKGKQVTVKNLKLLNINANGRGLSAGSDASNIELPEGKVYIDATVTETNIKAHHGVIAGGQNALVKIESKEISIESGISGSDSYGLGTVAGGEIQLGTVENKIENLSINGSLDSGARSFAIRSSNTNSNINILADNVSLSSNHTTIRSHAGSIFLGKADNMLESITAETYGNGLAGNAVVDFSAQNGRVEIYAKEVNLLNHEEGENAISVGSTGTLKIVTKENLYIKGNITSFATTPIIDINTDIDDALVRIEGNISLNPNGNGINNGATNITLGREGSYLKGKVTDAKGGITLTMNPGTIWEATGDSTITKVAGNGGTVKVDMTPNGAISKVNILENASGVAKVGATADVTDYIASLSGEEQTNAMQEVVNNVAVDGEAVATCAITDESMLTGAYTINVNGEEVTFTQAVNTKSDAVSDAGMTLKGHWRAHMNDMNKRMGELRNANGEHGVWTRMVRGESEYQGAKMQYNQYQMGYDEKLSVDKRWTLGAAVTFSEGDASYGSGSTDDKSTAFAIYGSKLNNDGTFVDLIARYARLESDLDDGNYGTGNYDANGYSVSAEFGKRIQQGKGLWIEPQVELTYGSVDGAQVNFSEDFTANYGSMDSFIARVGFAMGKDIKQGNVYARASYLYDFDGETETQFVGGDPISEDFGGGWWEVGVGANINLSKATYIYADVEKTFGGEVDTNWQWNLGVRYSS